MKLSHKEWGVLTVLMFLCAVPAKAEKAPVTGRVKDVNLQARLLVLEQIGPETIRGVQTMHLASVLDTDIVGEQALEELETGEIVTVRAAYYQEVRPQAGTQPTQTIQRETVSVRQEENLPEDAGKQAFCQGIPKIPSCKTITPLPKVRQMI